MVEAVRSLRFCGNPAPTNGLSVLEQKFDDVMAEQGIFGKAWNGFKEIFDVGQSAKDCESMLNKFKAGKVSFDEAIKYIEEFESKQKSMTGLFSNIATGVGSIAITTAAVAGGPIGWGVAATIGASSGAVLKTGINIIDRANNDIKDDEFDAKTIIKDAISGAITGTTSAVASGVGAGIRSGSIKLAVKNGTKCGIQCGALSGAGNYMSDAVFDNKEFTLGGLTKSTLNSAAVSGTVGAVVGAGMYGLASANGSVGQEVSKTTTQTIISDSTSSSTRKILGQVERDMISGLSIGAIASNITSDNDKKVA